MYLTIFPKQVGNKSYYFLHISYEIIQKNYVIKFTVFKKCLKYFCFTMLNHDMKKGKTNYISYYVSKYIYTRTNCILKEHE